MSEFKKPSLPGDVQEAPMLLSEKFSYEKIAGMKQPKNFRYMYDPQSKIFAGVSSNIKDPQCSTDIEPHFKPGFKTIFDELHLEWKLVENEEYYRHMARVNEVSDYERRILSRLDQMQTYFDKKYNFLISEVSNVKTFNHNMCTVTEVNFNSINKMLDRIDKVHTGQIEAIKIIAGGLDEHFKDNGEKLTVIGDSLLNLYVENSMQTTLIKKSYWTSRFINLVVRCYESCRARL